MSEIRVELLNKFKSNMYFLHRTIEDMIISSQFSQTKELTNLKCHLDYVLSDIDHTTSMVKINK